MKSISLIFILLGTLYWVDLIELDINGDLEDYHSILKFKQSQNKNRKITGKDSDADESIELENGTSTKTTEEPDLKIPFKIQSFFRVSNVLTQSEEKALSTINKSSKESDHRNMPTEASKSEKEIPAAEKESSEIADSYQLVEADSKIFSKNWDEYEDSGAKKSSGNLILRDGYLYDPSVATDSLSNSSNKTTACQICPEAFLEGFAPFCAQTYGILPSDRGTTETSYYSVLYGVECAGGVIIDQTELNILAEQERTKILEACLEQPDIFNLITVKTVPSTSNFTFTLYFETYSNAVEILDLLFSQLRVVASTGGNTSFCSASYYLLSNFEDINECVLGLSTCTPQQICINTYGSFMCACPVDEVLEQPNCTCSQTARINLVSKASVSFGGRFFLVDKPAVKEYKTSTIIMIIIVSILAILNMAIRHFRF